MHFECIFPPFTLPCLPELLLSVSSSHLYHFFFFSSFSSFTPPSFTSTSSCLVTHYCYQHGYRAIHWSMGNPLGATPTKTIKSYYQLLIAP